MLRRRRPLREIEFSFDSFLDVVANVVGIILRLILVAWMGARSYKAFVPPAPPDPPALADPAPLPEPTDPRLPHLAARRQELVRLNASLEQEQRRYADLTGQRSRLASERAGLAARQQALQEEGKKLEGASGRTTSEARALTLSVAELQKRSRALVEEIERIRKLPVVKKSLRYRTPVSKPLQTEEVMFECKAGRVTLLDVAALLADVRRNQRSRTEELQTHWEVSGLTEPVGSFRLRYVFFRQRTLLDGPNANPNGGTFRYGLEWEAEPIEVERGEPGEAALRAGSAFRKVIDTLDPEQTAITFWVYPDSFALYRQLRDYLHEKEMVVAGRPLLEGLSIGASSRKGTVSRGQ
jgi:hypothetical protein